MTAEKLQDAITLLPADLVAATDRLRTAPSTKVIAWKRWVSLAACLVLLLSTGMVFQQKLLPEMGAKTKSAAQESVAMAPAAMGGQTTMDSAAADVFEEEAAPEAPAEITDMITEVPAAENSLCIDHSHRFAEHKKEPEEVPSGYCGNLAVRVTLDGKAYDLHGADADTITNILRSLDYDSGLTCRCMAEFTVDTELLADVEVNLTQGFARCEKGQAALTEEQAQLIRSIIDSLQ